MLRFYLDLSDEQIARVMGVRQDRPVHRVPGARGTRPGPEGEVVTLDGGQGPSGHPRKGRRNRDRRAAAAAAARPPTFRLSRQRRRREKTGVGRRQARAGWLARAVCSVLVGAIAVAAVTIAGSRGFSLLRCPASGGARHACAEPGFLLGVYAAGSPPGYGPVAGFAKAAGRRPDLVGYFSSWAEPFKTAFASTLRGHGAVDARADRSRGRLVVQRSRRASMTIICAPTPTACAISATQL